VVIDAAATITTANKECFYDLDINAPAATVAFADSLKIAEGGDYTVTAGNVTHAGQHIVCGGDITHTTATTSNWGNSIKFTGTKPTFSISSAAGTQTASSCAISSTTDSLTLDFDADITVKSVLTPYTVLSTGSGNMTVTNTDRSIDATKLIISAGTVTGGSWFNIDTVLIPAGTLATGGAGQDTIGRLKVTGTLDMSGDTIVVTGDTTTTDSSATITADAASLFIFTADCPTLEKNGVTWPSYTELIPCATAAVKRIIRRVQDAFRGGPYRGEAYHN
jgi:hypothetical protein